MRRKAEKDTNKAKDKKAETEKLGCEFKNKSENFLAKKENDERKKNKRQPDKRTGSRSK